MERLLKLAGWAQGLRTPILLRLDILEYFTRKAASALAFLVANIGLVVGITAKIFPKKIRGVLLIVVLPLFTIYPYSFEFIILDYYAEFKYLWIFIGPHFGAAISLLIIYFWRKCSTLPIIIKIAIAWHLIEIPLQFTITDNNNVFSIHDLALFIYGFAVVFIFFVHLMKNKK